MRPRRIIFINRAHLASASFADFNSLLKYDFYVIKITYNVRYIKKRSLLYKKTKNKNHKKIKKFKFYKLLFSTINNIK